MKRFASCLGVSVGLAALLALPRAARAEDGPPPQPSSDTAPEPAAASAAPAAPVTKPAPSEAPADAPVVELRADDGRATIERRAATTSPSGIPIVETGLFAMGHWEHACVAPCRMKLDPKYSYRVSGDGLVPTDSFVLPQGQDRVHVDARMGSSTGRVAGVVLAGAGALAFAAGGAALIATPILESEDVGSQGFRNAVLAGGVGAVTVGVISAGVGLFLWLTNGSSARTEVQLARQARASQQP